MSNMEIMTMAVSITSLIIAAFAIILSIQFFKMSSKVSEDTKEAANEIKASIRELDAIFRQQHEETFSMAKTAFDEFRKRAFTERATEEDLSKLADEKTNERIENIRKEISEKMEAKISELGKKAKSTDAEISAIKASINELLGKAITESREVEKEVEAETLVDRVLVGLFDLREQGNRDVHVNDLSEYLKCRREAALLALHKLETGNLVYSEMKGHQKKFSLTTRGYEKAQGIELNRIISQLRKFTSFSP